MPYNGIGQETYSLRWEGNKPNKLQGQPFIVGPYYPNRFIANEDEPSTYGDATEALQDVAFAGNSVFIKGFSVRIMVQENLEGQHDGFDGNEYYRIMMLQDGTEPNISSDGLNACFKQNSYTKPYSDIYKFEITHPNQYHDYGDGHWQFNTAWTDDSVAQDGSGTDPDTSGQWKYIENLEKTWDPRNFYNTYSGNSLAATWDKNNSRTYTKSHDSGWIKNKVMNTNRSVLEAWKAEDNTHPVDYQFGL